MLKRVKVALYGSNGHQIQHLLDHHPHAELIAFACMERNELSPAQQLDHHIVQCNSLGELLEHPDIDLISLCSPLRKNQAADAIACLRAGKHVYAEKPCALSEDQLDEIIRTARETGRKFHEMAGTAFDPPYNAMRKLVQSGIIGTVVQVFAQKSYPYFDRRPQDEDADGGLLCQAGVHAMRYIEHVAMQRVAAVTAMETQLGNPDPSGQLRMAASLCMRLNNGGVASAIVNYLNPEGFQRWGNEHLRIFGTMGFMESIDGGVKTRLIVGAEDRGSINPVGLSRDYFNSFIELLVEKGSMPFTLEEELHPTRMVVRAKRQVSLA